MVDTIQEYNREERVAALEFWFIFRVPTTHCAASCCFFFNNTLISLYPRWSCNVQEATLLWIFNLSSNEGVVEEEAAEAATEAEGRRRRKNDDGG
jgi:hypothetical protein